jgi:hypothetical protein
MIQVENTGFDCATLFRSLVTLLLSMHSDHKLLLCA